MEFDKETDIEKGTMSSSPKVHGIGSIENEGKISSIDEENASLRPLSSNGKLARWGLKLEDIWRVEARGITRVADSEKNVPHPLHDYFHMFSLWFSINLQAVSIILGFLGPLAFGLGWVDCVCIVVFATALAACGPSYLATFGPESGNRTMVCLGWACHDECELICALTDHCAILHGLLAFKDRSYL